MGDLGEDKDKVAVRGMKVGDRWEDERNKGRKRGKEEN